MGYYVAVLLTIFLSLYAQCKVKLSYRKWDKVSNSQGITGADMARRMLDANGLTDVQVVSISGTLTDNYNPKTNVVSLSTGVYSGSSVAAIGIAAHEVGHAIQHSTGYLPIKIRSALVPIVNFGSGISWYLIIGGLLLNSFISSACAQNDVGYFIAMIGVILYASVTAFHVITLPVELNASSRARRQIDQLVAPSSSECRGIRKVLSAAALTYVASTLTAIVQLIRVLAMVSNSRNRR